MKEKYIYTVYIEGRYPRYEVNLYTLQDRFRKSDGWSNWSNLTTDALEFYNAIEPEMFMLRNKLIHSSTIGIYN